MARSARRVRQARKHAVYSSKGTELVRRLTEEGLRVFTVDKARAAAAGLGLSPGYFRVALHHLARSGWIVRLHKGLYALAGPMPGISPLHEFEVAMALVAPAAISHWSALSYHGLTEQSPRLVFVLTTAKSVPRRRNLKPGGSPGGYRTGDSVFQFIRVKPERFFGTKDVWMGESRIKVTDPERTLLDGLMAPAYCGDFSEVLHAFEVRAPRLDLKRILDYALRLDAATVKRLGWVLENQLRVGHRALDRLLRVPVSGYRVLDPTGPRRGPHDRRWMIQVNLPGRVQP